MGDIVLSIYILSESAIARILPKSFPKTNLFPVQLQHKANAKRAFGHQGALGDAADVTETFFAKKWFNLKLQVKLGQQNP